MLQKIKTVYIAHPIKGDIKGNMEKVLAICAQTHSLDTIPVAPYLVSLAYVNDDIKEDRYRGMLANFECLKRGYVDEVWLYGERISSGMREEVELAISLGIPVTPKTEETTKEFLSLYC